MLETIKELISEGKNYIQISEILGVDRRKISKICNENGIKKPIIKNTHCTVCGKEMGENTKNNTKCKTCVTRLRRLRAKKQAVDYLGGKCIICGFNMHLAALTFHHRDPNEKDFNIGSLKHKSWDMVKSELDKCDLLCANCHNIIHATTYNGMLDEYL